MTERTTMTEIREALKSALQRIGAGVVITYDYATAAEAESAIIIEGLTINYDYQLDMGSYRGLDANLSLIAKTQEDLDSLIDALDLLNDTTHGKLKDIYIVKIIISDDDPDVKSAKIDISAAIDEP